MKKKKCAGTSEGFFVGGEEKKINFKSLTSRKLTKH